MSVIIILFQFCLSSRGAEFNSKNYPKNYPKTAHMIKRIQNAVKNKSEIQSNFYSHLRRELPVIILDSNL